ncbi:dimethyl sulfoxide reductase anchor subunit family protein [Verminephrobacter aporrectodeae]|uniref:dimethyl sulfoxide reductase anchor subunit family protein n=1 Tax=Verminephrobacter aporrectodeae TaxID=1110389 RepID=UPI0022434139|nr:DmsC/YnfH family molybdoenzyme membrane anchor subunit [Verminephrobacter aporrectodeae]MCW8174126.1 DMSO reductase [Verminephrobacter aporrectodeae subsp. tuberculatae]MCW8197386.1 DMSO reductase [Verminephrobacter aporrectodeae subsp. tuberculatae]MCW8201905.1 DMSO reductase [Verminephrobacter aporrectodeae subsp. tuberculatae]
MNPAFSVVIFTTIAGAAQGLVVVLALARLAGMAVGPSFISIALIVAEAMLLIGLGASFGHLGRPERAWRAAMMWRTSWLSREVIVLPTFIAIVALWWLALRNGIDGALLPLAAIVVALLLWYCTAMIYACLRFIQEWAQPLTLVNFTLIGLSSGLILASALAVPWSQPQLLRVTGPAALAVTVIAWITRTLALRRNASLKHKSTLQTATGIRAPNLVQQSMGMSAGSFNTREFFHHAGLLALKNVKLALIVLGFALPTALLLWGVMAASGLAFVLAFLVQVPGLVADRWFFFAQAKHPQNLYYQVVS